MSIIPGLNIIRGENVLAFNCVKSALIYFCEIKGITKVYVPYYLCGSVAQALKAKNIFVKFYNIGSDFSPIFDRTLTDNELIIIVNYWNQLSEEKIDQLRKQYGNILVDNTQAFFGKPYKTIPTVYSCRKFFGVPDGGYLVMDTPNRERYFTLPREKALGNLRHLVGRFEQGAQDFYKDFRSHEETIYQNQCQRMSEFSENLLRSFDYERIVKARHRNQEILHKALRNFNQLQFDVNCNTFMYPFLIKEGEYLKQELIRRKIYVPTLWKEALDFPELNRFAKHLVKDLILLPIDQRYNENDMQYILDILLGIMGEIDDYRCT